MWAFIDIGGTNTRLGWSKNALKLDGKMEWRSEPDPMKAIEKIAIGINTIGGRDKLQGIVAGVAGSINRNTKIIEKSSNLPKWDGFDLGKQLAGKLGCPVDIYNDAELGGLGETIYGSGKGVGIVAYIAIGTGIGGVRVVNQTIDISSQGFEPGRQIIAINETGFSTWESLGSGHVLDTIYGKKPESIDDAYAWDEVTQITALGIHNVLLLWSPELVVLGGAISKRLNLKKLNSLVKMQLGGIFAPIPITTAKFSTWSGLYGGLSLVRNNEERP